MKQFEITPSKIDGHDYYEVCTENGKKYVHILGYFYFQDGEWHHVEYTWAYIEVGNTPITIDDIDKIEMEVKQYQEDGVAELVVIDTISAMKPNSLIIGDVTPDTPDGFYIDFK